MATARLAAAKRRAAVRSECDLRPTASGSRPCAAGIWIHPDPEAGCVRVYDRPQVARQDPALPQNQVTLLGFCGNEGTGNRARPVVALCSISGYLPLVQQPGPPGGALGGGGGSHG